MEPFAPSAPDRWAGLAAALSRGVGHAIVALVGLIGVAAFLYPFFLPSLRQGESEVAAHSGDALLLFTLLFVLALVALFAELESEGLNSKRVAALGVLVAINSVLRLADTALAFLNVTGFSPVYLLVILCGYCYGSRFGFLLGALSMAVSALVTGGVGPWLPYQMFAMGWVGLTAGWLPQRLLRGPRDERARRAINRETVALALFGLAWGFAFGAIMNLYFWPYTLGGALSWSPGLTVVETLQRYVAFYLATSFVWDLGGAIGNAALILYFGHAILKVLRRFGRRFFWSELPSLS